MTNLSSLILQTAMRLIVPLVLLYGAYMAIKGHNEPGGGFIGGLVIATGFSMYRMTNGREAFERMIPFHLRWLVFAGLAIAVLTGFVPMLLGQPFLTTYVDDFELFGESVHFASAVFFDVGVLLVVVSVSVGMIARLSEELGL